MRHPGRGARIGYRRISTIAQTLDQQNKALEAARVAETFADTMLGPAMTVQDLPRSFECVREGNTVVVSKLDRLGRTTSHRHFYSRPQGVSHRLGMYPNLVDLHR